MHYGANGCIGKFLKDLSNPYAEKLNLIDPTFPQDSYGSFSYDLLSCDASIKKELLSGSDTYY